MARKIGGHGVGFGIDVGESCLQLHPEAINSIALTCASVDSDEPAVEAIRDRVEHNRASELLRGEFAARGLSTPLMTKERNDYELRFIVERVTGIEPASRAWEALILPLNYTRDARRA